MSLFAFIYLFKSIFQMYTLYRVRSPAPEESTAVFKKNINLAFEIQYSIRNHLSCNLQLLK